VTKTRRRGSEAQEIGHSRRTLSDRQGSKIHHEFLPTECNRLILSLRRSSTRSGVNLTSTKHRGGGIAEYATSFHSLRGRRGHPSKVRESRDQGRRSR